MKAAKRHTSTGIIRDAIPSRPGAGEKRIEARTRDIFRDKDGAAAALIKRKQLKPPSLTSFNFSAYFSGFGAHLTWKQ